MSVPLEHKPPLIGVLMQNATTGLEDQYPDPHTLYTFVPSSYVELVQGAGGLPVLIPFDLPVKRFQAILNLLDGVLLPGGGTDLVDSKGELSEYQLACNKVIQHSKDKFDKEGINFPVFGICLGFQNIFLAFGKSSILRTTYFDDKSVNHPILVDEKEFAKARFFSQIPKEINDKVYGIGTMYYWHLDGIKSEDLEKEEHQDIHKELIFPAHSYTGELHDKLKFVALTEHRKYPIWGTQYHPEKTLHETGKKHHFLDRSKFSTKYTQGLARNFIDLAREKAKPLGECPEWLKIYFADLHVPINIMATGYEKCFLFPRLEITPQQIEATQNVRAMVTVTDR